MTTNLVTSRDDLANALREALARVADEEEGGSDREAVEHVEQLAGLLVGPVVERQRDAVRAPRPVAHEKPVRHRARRRAKDRLPELANVGPHEPAILARAKAERPALQMRRPAR